MQDPITVATEVAAAATVIYVALTALIWHTTSENTKATRQVLEAAQRPYVGISGVELVAPEYISGDSSIAARLDNMGSVPARAVSSEWTIKYPSAEKPVTVRANDTFTILFPSQTMTQSMQPPHEHQRTLYSGGVEVFITVTYQGLTDRQHSTTATYRLADDDRAVQGKFSLISGNFT